MQEKDIVLKIQQYVPQLDDLAFRLQDEYNNGVEFVQQEEDRIALCAILDLLKEVKKIKEE